MIFACKKLSHGEPLGNCDSVIQNSRWRMEQKWEEEKNYNVTWQLTTNQIKSRGGGTDGRTNKQTNKMADKRDEVCLNHQPLRPSAFGRRSGGNNLKIKHPWNILFPKNTWLSFCYCYLYICYIMDQIWWWKQVMSGISLLFIWGKESVMDRVHAMAFHLLKQ